MDITAFKKIFKSDAYLELRRYLTQKLLQLRNIDNLQEETEVELKAQKKAYRILKNILDELNVLETLEKKKTDKDSYQVI